MSIEKLTPEETAKRALTTPWAMCNLLNQARCTRFPGYWEGSAFRSHPCGIIVGTIKFTNDWHCDDYCSIAITDGDGWSRDFHRESRTHGDPHPRALNGSAVGVWSGGGQRASWGSEEIREKMESKILEILTAAAAHIDAVTSANEAAEKAAQEKRLQDHENLVRSALAKV